MPVLFLVMFYMMVIVGWVMNIIQVVGIAIADDPMTTLGIVKIVGIVLGPIGCILGWVHFFI